MPGCASCTSVGVIRAATAARAVTICSRSAPVDRAAAMVNHMRASTASCGTPRPWSYIAPRLLCAVAAPCSAARRYHATASTVSCGPPTPVAYMAEELKTSLTYNEALLRAKYQNGLNVLLDGPGGSRVTWSLADPVASDSWGSSEIAMVQALMPHIRQFIRGRQALVRAEAHETTVTALLDNPRIGVLHLDRRGQIIAVNDRARSILRLGDGLSDRDGVLGARNPDDQLRLEGLVAAALPAGGAIAVSGSMLLGRSSGLPPFVVHVKPVAVPQPDYGARHVAALVLIVEPRSQHRIDPGLVARTLGLTPMESRVAVWLAEGRSVDEMAGAMGNTKHAVYWHLQRIYRKLSISRQTELVRLVLSLADLG